jgi:hypothetical protein
MAYARLAAQAYYGCIVLFGEADDPAWGEWPAYCDQRGAEVVGTFAIEAGVAEAPPAADEPAPAEAPPAEE